MSRTTPKLEVRVEASGRVEAGPLRPDNQDVIVLAGTLGIASGAYLNWHGRLPDSGLLAAVVDGMGGYAGGAQAAAIVGCGLANLTPTGTGYAWDEWFRAISERVVDAGQAWGMNQMGATGAVLALCSDGIAIANVGDCRIYRAGNGRVEQMTVDDRADPASSAVTQAMGVSRRNRLIEPHVSRRPYAPGWERYLLCTDGVWSTLDATALTDLALARVSPGQVVEAAADLLYARHGDDNGSIVIVDVASRSI
ncbi:MAG: protein phosphatase 2C domain-containing protein [Bifidobacteriaceae bacterium]|jgi:serine/threonine protein phosphatase PrpC|nr:protein phosphatase 2C domain-containing protein [Bifidobacteriaceae bacterium]